MRDSSSERHFGHEQQSPRQGARNAEIDDPPPWSGQPLNDNDSRDDRRDHTPAADKFTSAAAKQRHSVERREYQDDRASGRAKTARPLGHPGHPVALESQEPFSVDEQRNCQEKDGPLDGSQSGTNLGESTHYQPEDR